jgi:hypothetical protein
LLHSLRVYAIPRKPAARAAFVSCRYPPERLPQNRGMKQPPAWCIGFKVFQNECGDLSPPDLQLREDHAA